MSDTDTHKPLRPGRVEELFTAPDGTYRFSRWGRPIAPAIFGVDEKTAAQMKRAMQLVAEIAEMELVEEDPELGANLLMFFCSDWDELDMVPNLNQLVPDFDILKTSLKRTGANQYRSFTFDDAGAIRSCIVLLRHDEHMAETPIQAIGVGQMVQAILLWGDEAFDDESPLVIDPDSGFALVRRGYAAVIRAAYDPEMPAATTDNRHAMQLAGRAKALIVEDDAPEGADA